MSWQAAAAYSNPIGLAMFWNYDPPPSEIMGVAGRNLSLDFAGAGG